MYLVTGGMPTAFVSMMMMMMPMPSIELLQVGALVRPLEMKSYVSCGCETARTGGPAYLRWRV
jgi:hypothetical protein